MAWRRSTAAFADICRRAPRAHRNASAPAARYLQECGGLRLCRGFVDRLRARAARPAGSLRIPATSFTPSSRPDGKWIAFTGEYDGNADVYVIPSEGGEPRRLTYHPADRPGAGMDCRQQEGPVSLQPRQRASRHHASVFGFHRRWPGRDASRAARQPDQFLARWRKDRLQSHLAGISHLEALSRRLEQLHRDLRSEAQHL